jgi:hypothetical protein
MNRLYNTIKYSFQDNIKMCNIKSKFNTYINSDVINHLNGINYYNFENYKKIKLNEYSNDKFELFLISWNKMSETKIHNHPYNGCILHLLSGKLQEHLYDNKLNIKTIKNVEANTTSYLDNTIGFHKILCIEKALSLHLYSPVNYKMTNYN